MIDCKGDLYCEQCAPTSTSTTSTSTTTSTTASTTVELTIRRRIGGPYSQLTVRKLRLVGLYVTSPESNILLGARHGHQ